METKKISGTITDKKPYTGDSAKAPQGDFYMDKTKYACWDEDTFNNFKEGDMVQAEYTEKENEYNGKTYTNRSISKMTMIEENNEADSAVSEEEKTVEVEYIKISAETPSIVSNIYKIGNLEYEVTLRLLNGS